MKIIETIKKRTAIFLYNTAAFVVAQVTGKQVHFDGDGHEPSEPIETPWSQFVVECSGTVCSEAVDPDNTNARFWIKGSNKNYVGFTPHRVVIVENFAITFRDQHANECVRYTSAQKHLHGTLEKMSFGERPIVGPVVTAENVLISSIGDGVGVSLHAFADGQMVERNVWWPVILARETVDITCSVDKSILQLAALEVEPPKGFEPVRVDVEIRIHFFGPVIDSITQDKLREVIGKEMKQKRD